MSGEDMASAVPAPGYQPTASAADASSRSGIPDAAFERIVRFLPGYDHTGETPNRGRGSMRIVFILRGRQGAVQFMIGTSWGPRSSDASTHRLIASGTIDPCRPNGWDVGYHSHAPLYEGSEEGDCDLLPGGRCHYDGSGLQADEWVEPFVTGGDEWVWAKLEQRYNDLFAGAIATETGTAETGTGSVHEGAGRQASPETSRIERLEAQVAALREALTEARKHIEIALECLDQEGTCDETCLSCCRAKSFLNRTEALSNNEGWEG